MNYDPRIPAREECVLSFRLEHWAAETPTKVAFSFHGGESWTWAEMLEKTQQVAKGLQDPGVKKGDHVLS